MMQTIDVLLLSQPGSLRIERDMQEVTWEDALYEDWDQVDANGHRHKFVKAMQPGEVWRKGKRRKDRPTHFPTLLLVIDRRRHCDGREGLYSHDPHVVEESHYECRDCDERIEPGHGPGATLIESRRAAYLDGQLIPGDQAEQILGREAAVRSERASAEASARTAKSLGYPADFA